MKSENTRNSRFSRRNFIRKIFLFISAAFVAIVHKFTSISRAIVVAESETKSSEKTSANLKAVNDDVAIIPVKEKSDT